MAIEKPFVDSFKPKSVKFTTELPKWLYWQSEVLNSVTGAVTSGFARMNFSISV